MGNWVELHQNGQPCLVNLDNVSMIINIERFNDYTPKTGIAYNDGQNGYCDETYEEIKKLLPYFVP